MRFPFFLLLGTPLLHVALDAIYPTRSLSFVLGLIGSVLVQTSFGLCHWSALQQTTLCQSPADLPTDLHSTLFSSSSTALTTFAMEVGKARLPVHDLQQVYIDIDKLMADIKLMDIRHKEIVDERFARVRAKSRDAGMKMARFGIDLEYTLSR